MLDYLRALSTFLIYLNEMAEFNTYLISKSSITNILPNIPRLMLNFINWGENA